MRETVQVLSRVILRV